MSALTLPSRGEAANGALRYERHRPEQTTLYRLVQQHAASFIAHTEASTGSELPRFIKDEFDAFLECGILAHGFLRLRCGECGHDKLLAFSCKRRGFCPSCGARRMSQTAAHRVDHVIPHVPVRQWVLSLPIPLRVLLAGLSQSPEGYDVLQRMLNAIGQPSASVPGVIVGASIGVAVCPAHGHDSATLLAVADRAKYVAKRTGRNHWHYAAIDG